MSAEVCRPAPTELRLARDFSMTEVNATLGVTRVDGNSGSIWGQSSARAVQNREPLCSFVFEAFCGSGGFPSDLWLHFQSAACLPLNNGPLGVVYCSGQIVGLIQSIALYWLIDWLRTHEADSWTGLWSVTSQVLRWKVTRLWLADVLEASFLLLALWDTPPPSLMGALVLVNSQINWSLSQHPRLNIQLDWNFGNIDVILSTGIGINNCSRCFLCSILIKSLQFLV